ncbi:uncharacterized protein [Ptychodera flava]|uniref:uncharacterized protein n=1 Tax=Ptychodera flava TaxID=63121 RepID=UPI00396A6DEE
MKEELAEFVGGLLRERESPVNLVEAASTYDEDSYEYSDSLYSSYSSTSTFTQDQPVGFYQPVNRGTHQDSATAKLTQDDAYYDDAVVHVVVPVSAADAGLVNDYENPHKAVFHHCTAVVDDQDYQPIAEKIRALSPFPPASQSEDMIAQENVPPIDDQSSDSHIALRTTKRRTLSLRSANKPLSPVTGNRDIKDEIQGAIYCSESHSGMEDMDDVYIAKKARHPCKNDEHNAKERVRRARIKHSADVLKELIPGCTMKTDKASVFEQAVNYVIFMQGKVSPKMKGKVHQEFIAKYIRSGSMEEEDSS